MNSRFLSFVLFVVLILGGGAVAQEKPNILLIMVDDMGFSDLGYHGGDAETPNLDALAHEGVRFSQFYNEGRCCPTRATLMTGLHPHQTGIGWMTQPPGSDRGRDQPPAYQGYINEQCVTIAEALKPAGYITLMSGKWHLGYNDQDRWPLQRGFDKYYGSISGATRFFFPHGDRGITFGNEAVEPPLSTTDEVYYTTDAFTDYAIRFMEEHAGSDPFFLYLAYTAPHWPLQAFEDDIAKYRGMYKGGWDTVRERRYKRQVELGLIDESWNLSPRTPGIPDWESLDEKKRDEMDLKMAIFSAMVDRVDQNIGKLTAYLKEAGIYDNTLIFFLSDNGGCQEGGMLGRGEFFDATKRNLEDDNSYGEAWANASNTPFRYYKHFNHEGGIATPFFMHWPAKIQPREEWYTEPAQLIDIMPTILDVAGANYPKEAHGEAIHSLDGVSLRPAFDGKSLERKEPIFIEHETNACVRDGDWKLVGKSVATIDGTDESKWELYNMAEDRTETNDLAKAKPEKVKELAAEWEKWAERVKVYPRGDKSPPVKKGNSEPKAEPEPPQVTGRAFTVTATVQGPNPRGVVVSHGGVRFGYSLHFRDGRPAFSVRDEGKLTELVAGKAVKGKVEVAASLTKETMSILVNGKEVASRKSPGLISEQPGLGMYVGLDFRDPVGDYKVPNKFTGKILGHKVQVVIPKVSMRTKWGKEVTAENVWQGYPRPQLRRENWTNLNGYWDYAVTGKGTKAAPKEWDGKILVPFAIEAPLSGVEKRFGPEDALWYSRAVSIEKKEGKRYLLNFEAVDYQSTVWVNGEEVGSNTGGNLPFSFDITKAVKDGENEIRLKVTDSTDAKGTYQLHGKQRLNPKGIWYTPVSGIWQTVWIEEVPDLHLRTMKVTPENSGKISIDFVCGENAILTRTPSVKVEVSLEGKVVASGSGSLLETLSVTAPEPKLWSPDAPTLYDLTVTLGDDVVKSYFGFRETTVEKDAEGNLRLFLNGEPIFHWGTLDQGWWPDGLLTPPSEEAMVSDIQFLKDAGFNTIRKHIKVEPRLYYYHCDKVGMMMWQDQVSHRDPVGDPEWTRLQPNPEKGVWPDWAHEQYLTEHKRMIDTLYNHPCIVQWVPFNERWGQHSSESVGEWVVKYDPSRQVNIASGGNFFPVGHIVDEHRYPHPGFPFELGEGGRFDGFVKVMGEFGGHGFPVEGHVWDPNSRNWGYGGLPKDKEEWLERYETSIKMLAELKKQGIAAGIYTQTTDVEGEINGLITYDREVQKIAPEQLKQIAKELFE